MLRLLALLLALLIAFSPAAAFADDDREVAMAQFKEAKRLYDDEKYQPALKLFELAWKFSGSPNARLYIGKCHLALGQNEDAYNELRGTLDDAAKTGDPSYDNTRRAAAAELALLEPKVGLLLVVLADPGRTTEVTVGGAPFEVGRAIAMASGQVEVKGTSDGEEAILRPTVVAGKTTSVALYFPPKQDKSSAPTPPPPPPEAPGYTALQVGGFIAIGAGGAILVGGGILGALAAGRFQALDSACEGQRCDDPGVSDVIDSGKTFELVSYIMLGVGGAGVLTGGALVLFGGEGDSLATEEEGATAVLDVAPLPGGGLLQLTGRF